MHYQSIQETKTQVGVFLRSHDLRNPVPPLYLSLSNWIGVVCGGTVF